LADEGHPQYIGFPLFTYYISVFTVLPQQIQIELLGMVISPGSGKEGVKRDAASSNGTIKGS
jgi:hypothetical protein